MKRTLFLAVLLAAPAYAADCSRIDQLRVLGAEMQKAACLLDLSTRYLTATGHTDVSDWGTLHSQQTRNPSGAVPGIQIDGYFPDTSTTNAHNGWQRNAAERGHCDGQDVEDVRQRLQHVLLPTPE